MMNRVIPHFIRFVVSTIPATIDLNPSGDTPEASVIWLHGLGADGNDFVPVVERFSFAHRHKVRFVFPHAPMRSITINDGMTMRAWYNITHLDLSKNEDMAGLQDSEKLVHLLIEREEAHGIPTDRITLAGFSQGAALALYSGLRFPKKLSSIIALSGYLPSPNTLKLDEHSANQATPVFIGHGMFDPIVPIMLGQLCKEQLEGFGYAVNWHSYPITHTVAMEEIEDIDIFLNKRYSES